MTPSQRIILDAGRALRERVLSTADDLEFHQFRREVFDRHNLSTVDLGRIAGVDSEHVLGKRYAGTAAAIKAQGGTPSSELIEKGAPYSGKALSEAPHGDPDDLDAWWLANCPLQYKADLLAGYIDSGGWWGELYRTELGRDPDTAGLAWWKERIARLFRDSLR